MNLMDTLDRKKREIGVVHLDKFDHINRLITLSMITLSSEKFESLKVENICLMQQQKFESLKVQNIFLMQQQKFESLKVQNIFLMQQWLAV
jgi:D-alanyl-lipoteichoic acid acyltransferase DltB (MBOAT superfamily)